MSDDDLTPAQRLARRAAAEHEYECVPLWFPGLRRRINRRRLRRSNDAGGV